MNFWRLWKVWKIWQLYNSTTKWPYSQLLSISNSTEKKISLVNFWRLYNSTTIWPYDLFESWENFPSLQPYSFLHQSNEFFDWIVLRGEEKFLNLRQLYTSTWIFRLSLKFFSFNLQFCIKISYNLPSIYNSTAKKTCQWIFWLFWICKIKGGGGWVVCVHKIPTWADKYCILVSSV